MAEKLPIPDALKADLPQNKWGKVLAATPVVMTVIATLLAGLSSGEMVRAEYDRSLAAQQQSKAGDQWNYFQAKRLRAAMQRSTLDILHATASIRPVDARSLTLAFDGTPTQALLESSVGKDTVDCLVRAVLPLVGSYPVVLAPIEAVLAAVDAGESDTDIARLLKPVKPTDIAAALNRASANVRAIDEEWKPIFATIDTIEKGFAILAVDAPDSPKRCKLNDFIAARLALAAGRYDYESRQNQVIAQLLELQVRQSNISAERHHERSQRFFYGMLLAQMAVIVSTFSMARKKGNFLWAFAATAGLVAVAFASYVYLFV